MYRPISANDIKPSTPPLQRPIFISLNTSLERREMGEVIYEGKKVKLSGAVIPIIEPGNVCLNPIENYKTIKFE